MGIRFRQTQWVGAVAVVAEVAQGHVQTDGGGSPGVDHVDVVQICVLVGHYGAACIQSWRDKVFESVMCDGVVAACVGETVVGA